MKPQRVVATVMLLMSSTLMAATSRDIAYPAVLCILGLAGLQRRLTWDIKPGQRVIRSSLLLLLAIFLALHYRFSPHPLGQEQAIALAWQTVARYFLASMVLTLFLGSAAELPPSLGMFHIAITICTGQILLLDDLLILFRSLEFLSVILVVLYAATAVEPGRERTMDGGPQAAPSSVVRRSLSSSPAAAVILLIAANFGWIVGSLLYQHVEVLNYVPLWLARQRALEQITGGASSVGFTTSGQLSSMLAVLQDQDTTVALTIESRNSPGYLRARAFETYRSSEWYDRSTPTWSNPLSVHFGGRTNTFRLEEEDYSHLEYMTIRHGRDSSLQDAAFAPPGAVTVETSVPTLQHDNNGIIYVPGLAAGKSYRIGYTVRAFRNEPTGMQLRWMLDQPNQLDPRVTELAGRIFAGRTTTVEKIDAVINHFRDHYTYSLSMDIPKDQDKLMYFLLSGSSGYCEYFASGAAILLRIAGVPTRYVTGFFVTQRDEQSGLWIARNMDAHAWAEAWDEQRKCWTIVEATVQGGPSTTLVDAGPEQADNGLGARLRRLTEAVYQYGLFGLVGWLFTSYGVFAGSLGLSIVLGCTLGWLVIRWRRRRSRAGSGAQSMQSPAVTAMHRMLDRMDRNVKAMGLRRHPAETLTVFAARLASTRIRDFESSRAADAQSAAAWYLQYADLRYARSISPEQLQRLRQSERMWRNRP